MAGDTAKAAADNGVDMVGATLLYPNGYATQNGGPQHWNPENAGLVPLEERVNFDFDGREIHVGAYQYDVRSSVSGNSVPVIFLTTDVPENSEGDRRITDRLYDDSKKFQQFAVLGIGSFLMLQRLGMNPTTFHMNEGHSSLVTFEQYWQSGEKIEPVIASDVFFNHTVVPQGMPRVPQGDVVRALGRKVPEIVHQKAVVEGNVVTNQVAANLSRASFGVSEQHSHVLTELFPNIPFSYITNGVHPPTWVTPRMAEIYDKRIGPEWRTNPECFLKARMISPSELWNAHHQNKVESLEQISELTRVKLEPDVFTLVFARRAAVYKQWDFIFNDGFIDYLERELPGRMQVIFAGKPHPKDEDGRKMMERALAAGARLKNHKVVQLPDYGIDYSKLLLMAADAWLNNPQLGKEACATSGMKAALNGIPHISNPEGWWREAPRFRGVNGWTFQGNGTSEANAALNAIKYAKTSYDSGTMAAMMPQIISDFGPPFHSTRMLRQYQARAWNMH